MSLPEPGSSVFSSPSTSIREMMSPKAPSSPTAASSQCERAGQSSQSAQDSSTSTSPTSCDPLQAKPMSAALSDQTTCKIDNIHVSNQSPKRIHQEIEDEEEGSEHPRKCRAKSHSESVIAVTSCTEQAQSNKTKATPKVKDTPEKAQPQPPVRNDNRPSRARNPPKEYWVVDEKEQKSAKKAVQAKKPASKVFDPIFITSNSTSRLGKADVYHLLLEDLAWTSLTRSQQKELLSMLPPNLANQEVLKGNANILEEIARPQAFTLSNDCFRTDVAKFKEDLQNGHLAKTWQAAAEQAVIERATGKFDAWKAEEAESWWGQKSK